MLSGAAGKLADSICDRHKIGLLDNAERIRTARQITDELGLEDVAELCAKIEALSKTRRKSPTAGEWVGLVGLARRILARLEG